METSMQIYWIKAQAPRRVLALAKYLGADAELIHVTGNGLKTPEYAALNPNMKAPTLVDGDIVLWEASAIMTYLCIKAGSDMWPTNKPAEQVEVLRWLSWNDWHWARAFGDFYFGHIVKKTFNFGQTDSEALKSNIPDLRRYAKVLDAHLQGRDYVACGRLTIADFQLASMAHYWRESEMPLQDFSNVVRWLNRLDGIPAWADPWPEESRTLAA
jgi:glutathione S-transferase